MQGLPSPRQFTILLIVLTLLYLYWTWTTLDFRKPLPLPGVMMMPKGGIGNQLYQYACHYALAKKLGWHLYIKPKYSFPIQASPFLAPRPYHRRFKPYHGDFALDLFQIQDLNIISNETINIPRNKINWLSDKSLLKLTLGHRKSSRIRLVSLKGKFYCQSLEFWKNYTDDIKTMFQVREDLITNKKVVKFAKQIKYFGQRSVAVHIRRGDYLESDRRYLPTSYQRRAIRKMTKLLEQRGIQDKPVFFIFSDDIDYAKEKLKDLERDLDFQFVFVSDKVRNAIQEFYLMTLCSHIIIPNSTFGWWAAYLMKNKEKIVIAATLPIVTGSGFEEDDFSQVMNYVMKLPKEWIVIDPFNGGL